VVRVRVRVLLLVVLLRRGLVLHLLLMVVLWVLLVHLLVVVLRMLLLLHRRRRRVAAPRHSVHAELEGRFERPRELDPTDTKVAGRMAAAAALVRLLILIGA
jgi:hypothetical protein